MISRLIRWSARNLVLVLIGAVLVGGTVFLLIRHRHKALKANAVNAEGQLIAQSPQAEPAMGVK